MAIPKPPRPGTVSPETEAQYAAAQRFVVRQSSGSTTWKPTDYLYLNKKLYRVLDKNRTTDKVILWDFEAEKMVVKSLAAVQRNRRPAFRRHQVAKMVNRGRSTLNRVVSKGYIRPPVAARRFSPPYVVHEYIWSEDNVYELWDYLASTHRGRPRKDMLNKPQPMPTKKELRAIINDEDVMYVKRGDKFIPSWQAQDF